MLELARQDQQWKIQWLLEGASSVELTIGQTPNESSGAKIVTGGAERGQACFEPPTAGAFYVVATGRWPSGKEQRFVAAPRRFELDGWINARDVGGYRAAQGLVRYGVLLRSSDPSRLAGDSLAAIGKLGIARAIDLRTPFERQAGRGNPDALPFPVRPIPIVEREFMDPEEWKRLEVSPSELAWQQYRDAFLDKGSVRLGEILTAIAEQSPTLIFCGGGKDRTGIVIALALSAVGVGRADIVRDYALSAHAEAALRARVEPFANLLAEKGVNPKYFEPAWQCDTSLLERALDVVDDTHGGVERYLVDRCGVTAEALERLRHTLVAS